MDTILEKEQLAEKTNETKLTTGSVKITDSSSPLVHYVAATMVLVPA